MTEPRTLPEAFQRTVARQPDAVALRAAGDEAGITWREYGETVRRIAGGLAALGVRRGDTVATMLVNRPEFHLSETAAAHLGATTYSVYNTNPPEQIGYLLNHAATRVVITEQQYAAALRASGAPVEHLLVVEDGDLDRLEPGPGFDFDAAWQSVRPDDVLCLIYTSGTTGPPKGVEHTHRGILGLGDSFTAVWPMAGDDVSVSYLPTAHLADRAINHYFAIRHGVRVVSVPDLRQLAATLPQVRPTIFAAVPRVWEKTKHGADLKLEADPQLAAAFEAGVPEVLAGIRAALGLDRVRWALSGSAAIPPHVFAFLAKLGIPVAECWGMSECGIGTGTTPAEARVGTVGKPLPGIETRVADDGELLVRGALLMKGYRDDPVRTAEAIDSDGWLHSGDIVSVDKEGYFSVVDRKKELIISAGGKNMSPSNIEHAIVSGSTLIGSVVAIGDSRPYNVALITLDPDAAAAFGAQLGIDPDPAVLAKDERVRQEVQSAVDAGNAQLARVEQIKRFTVLPSYWEPGGDELTPTMKLKRRAIADKYAIDIDQLYGEAKETAR